MLFVVQIMQKVLFKWNKATHIFSGWVECRWISPTNQLIYAYRWRYFGDCCFLVKTISFLLTSMHWWLFLREKTSLGSQKRRVVGRGEKIIAFPNDDIRQYLCDKGRQNEGGKNDLRNPVCALGSRVPMQNLAKRGEMYGVSYCKWMTASKEQNWKKSKGRQTEMFPNTVI